VTIIELFINPTFAAMVSGLAGLIAGFVMKRVEKAPDVQASLNAAVAGVITHYTEALKASSAQIEAMRAEIVVLRETVERQSETIDQQSIKIGELEEHIDLFTAAFDKAGVTPPSRRKRAASAS
jgi:hypothetical protein